MINSSTAVAKTIVIIPTYKEKENIEKIIRKVFSLPASFHILIIDDNSPDGTGAIVKGLQKEYPGSLYLLERPGKLGLGSAYISGFKWALERSYDFVMEMDADFSHNPEDLVRLLETCTADGADMSVGSRYITGVNVVNWPMGRVIMSYYASAYVRFVTRMPIRDTTAGFVCYSAKVLKTIPMDQIRMRGYGFQIEMKFKTLNHGFTIKEIPIIFTDRKLGSSKMSGGIFSEALWGVIMMKLRFFFQNFKK